MLRTFTNIPSKRAVTKKKGDRCWLQNFSAAGRHFEKKGRTRWHIFHPRMIHLFVWIRSHKFVSDDRSVARKRAARLNIHTGIFPRIY